MKRSRRILFSIPQPLLYHGVRFCFPGAYRGQQAVRYKEKYSGHYSLKGFDELQCIYVHIPKAGGVSLSRTLFGSLVGHRPIYAYYTIFSPQELRQYFKFTVVRNPWDRVVSAYHFLAQGGFEPRDETWFNENLASYDGFEDFVRRWLTRSNIYRAEPPHFIPQMDFIRLNGKIRVDRIYKLEEIDAAYKELNQKLGVTLSPHRENATRERDPDYRQYYSDDTRDIVGSVYRDDIKNLGYTF